MQARSKASSHQHHGSGTLKSPLARSRLVEQSRRFRLTETYERFRSFPYRRRLTEMSEVRNGGRVVMRCAGRLFHPELHRALTNQQPERPPLPHEVDRLVARLRRLSLGARARDGLPLLRCKALTTACKKCVTNYPVMLQYVPERTPICLAGRRGCLDMTRRQGRVAIRTRRHAGAVIVGTLAMTPRFAGHRASLGALPILASGISL